MDYHRILYPIGVGSLLILLIGCALYILMLALGTKVGRYLVVMIAFLAFSWALGTLIMASKFFSTGHALPRH